MPSWQERAYPAGKCAYQITYHPRRVRIGELHRWDGKGSMTLSPPSTFLKAAGTLDPSLWSDKDGRSSALDSFVSSTLKGSWGFRGRDSIPQLTITGG
jgi:hypothetical protein